MTGYQLRVMRLKIGLSCSAFGVLLGYRGTRRNLSLQVRQLEALRVFDLPIEAEARALALLKKESRRWNSSNQT